ncbi:hypothetical protein [Pseudomonas linyingensis]|uniref:hypothetical protein n=1 Tax=Pseudomonas linyingensis TaxID=915471 RepID=UPI001113406E|nr:hypothetical protein [Pseudomonas linyingensis]
MEFHYICDSERIVRTTFSPEHFDGVEFSNAAISLDDLSSRGVSVDREGITPLSALDKRIEAQVAKNPDARQSVVYSVLLVGAVRAIQGQEASQALEVKADPIKEENEGHALILSAKPRGKAELRALRLRLIGMMKAGLHSKGTLQFKA